MVEFPYRYINKCVTSVPGILVQSSMELMKEIAILEVEIMRMERYLLSLYRAAFQQHIPDLLGKHAANIESKINTPLHSTVDDPNYNFEFGMSKVYVDKYDRSSSPSALVCSDDQLESATKSSSRRVIWLNNYGVDILYMNNSFMLIKLV